MSNYLRFDNNFSVLKEVDIRYLFSEFAEEEKRLNPSNYVPIEEIPYSIRKKWADMMVRDQCGETEAPLVRAGRVPGFHEKEKKKTYMKPKSREERKKFIRKNKFYTLAYGKYGKVRVV